MSDDIIVRLKAVEAAEMDVANSCDLPPNLTANWEYAMAVRDGIAELAALRAEVERLNKSVARILDREREFITQRDAAEAEVERLRADAERYRWLRDGPSSGQWSYLEGCCEDALDEAVDKMRASSPTDEVRK